MRRCCASRDETGCELVVTLGALLGDVPHTRPVRVTGASSDPVLAQLLGIVPSRYEGPTGIVGVLHDTCSVVGIRSLSLWAPVPHYVARQTSPAGSRALLERLALVTGVRLDLGPLDQLEQDWRAAVDVIVSDDDDTERYVRELEQRVDDEPEPRHPSLGGISIPDGDELAAELERYLRDETDPDDP